MPPPASTILFLDDSPARRKWFHRECPHGFAVHSAESCVFALGRFKAVDVLLLDHDLGDEVDSDPWADHCGSAVVRWIVANRPVIGKIIVHSLSDTAPAMRDALRAAGYDAECVGFMSLIGRFDEVLA